LQGCNEEKPHCFGKVESFCSGNTKKRGKPKRITALFACNLGADIKQPESKTPPATAKEISMGQGATGLQRQRSFAWVFFPSHLPLISKEALEAFHAG